MQTPDIAIVGPWAKEKLDALSRYLDFYTKVLKNQPWRTIYVDAFAGGGRAVIRAKPTPASSLSPLFPELTPDDCADEIELIDGSPLVALNVTNPFSRYVFIEPTRKRAAELKALAEEYSNTHQIDVLQNCAAEGIAWIASQPISKRTHRGVAFLDPFGAQLDWSSIQRLADTGLFETIVNFSLNSAIQRMLPNSCQVPDEWAQTLDAYFGSRDWYEQVYTQNTSPLFNDTSLVKRPDWDKRLLQLYRDQLGKAFGHVSMPHLIRNTRGVPLYYLLWAGPHRKGLQGADYILTMGEKIRERARA